MTAAPPLAPVAVASPASLAATAHIPVADAVAVSGSSRAVADGGPVAPPTCGAGGEVAALRAAAAALAAAAAGASGWAGPERQGILTALNLTIDTLQAIRSAVLIAERDADTWRGSGDPTFEAWVGRKTRLGKRGGAARVRQATELDTVPDVREAVTDGRIPLEHAGIIAKVAATGTPAQRQAATSPAGQETLLGLAAGQDAGTFARTADRWAAHVDPAGLERDHQAQRRARFLHLTHTPHGTHLKGLLDSLTGHQVALALEAATPDPPPTTTATTANATPTPSGRSPSGSWRRWTPNRAPTCHPRCPSS
ncbi:hypothetical protein [Pengzhenrongella phosphoraccumulans]|uniref:hypothetical protein n=1 Tax=Pengzhenrongella phosphoraccumulans TaxID=3114394 RepID=UPI00388F6A1A